MREEGGRNMMMSNNSNCGVLPVLHADLEKFLFVCLFVLLWFVEDPKKCLTIPVGA